ncbi:MAG: phage major capsid protein [Oscillospiraceae bacterium]|nr:phage major capsid protein [Oscillospiraceae bacterium]
MAFYETMKLEKGMYAVSGKSFTQVLEELDPSRNYKGTDLEGLDAYQRQLKRFDIKVSGENCDTVEKFFQTSESAALFPEFVSRAVQQGIDRANKLSNLVATVTKIDASDYRTITATDGTSIGTAVTEGGALPETVIQNQSGLVTMKKHGRLIKSSYEALRFHKLDLFAVMLRHIGEEIVREQIVEAATVLYSGDGNDNAAAKTTLSAAPTYNDLLGLWAKLSPFELNTMVASTATMKDLLSITEFKDAVAGLNFQGTGSIGTPMGANLIHVPSFTDGIVVGFDKNCALEMVQAGEILVDYDKLIDRQMECASISAICGFAKIYPNAVHALSYTISK